MSEKKKKWLRFLGFVLIVAAAFGIWAALTPLVLSSLLTEQEMSDAVGIVSSADGPTSILVTGTVNWPVMILSLVLCVAAIVGGIILIRKFKKG